MKKYSTVLSIAGSDSIGGAGIQADIKTCSAIGTYAMTAITAITAQNTTGVKSYIACQPTLLKEQLSAVLDDVTPDAVKLGMIPDYTSADIIADTIEKYNLKNIVVDPVLVATSGTALSDNSTLSVMKSRLFPLATVITPNIPEAETIAEHKISSVDDMISTAKDFLESYSPKAVLIKGGHMTNTDTLTDILATKLGIKPITNHYINTPNTHGTGCSLSSAIASYLAMGQNIDEAVTNACQWLHCAILHGKDYQLGHGHGPINHIFK